MADRPRRGRPPLTSREAILDAVLEIGLDVATSTSVAARLGVDQSTLYRHVASVEDMLDGAAAVAITRGAWPEPDDDWAEYLRACAKAMWTMFGANPGLAQRLRLMSTVPAELVAQSYVVVEYLTTHLGLDLREAALIVDTIGDMTADSYLTVEALHRPSQGGGTYSDQVLSRMAEAGEVLGDPIVSGEYLDAMRYAMGRPGEPSSWWLDKVDLVIDGVHHRLDRRRDRPAS
ncbi:TetR/AcrR family transcriptional regulator [Microbacterium oxydans]|uniref:TetR/AcrR family transcriptional regulator n=1 Tax=Microbacterium oxydans TaxID=82380 RepID=UPI00366D66BA